MGEKTLEVSVDKFIELCKIDARMETLKAYLARKYKIGDDANGEETGREQCEEREQPEKRVSERVQS